MPLINKRKTNRINKWQVELGGPTQTIWLKAYGKRWDISCFDFVWWDRNGEKRLSNQSTEKILRWLYRCPDFLIKKGVRTTGGSVTASFNTKESAILFGDFLSKFTEADFDNKKSAIASPTDHLDFGINLAILRLVNSGRVSYFDKDIPANVIVMPIFLSKEQVFQVFPEHLFSERKHKKLLQYLAIPYTPDNTILSKNLLKKFRPQELRYKGFALFCGSNNLVVLWQKELNKVFVFCDQNTFD